MRITTRTTALSTALLLTFGLSACDSTGDSQPVADPGDSTVADAEAPEQDRTMVDGEFCEASGALDQLNESIGQINPADAEASLDSLRSLVEQMSSADAPEEVSAAVDTVTTGLQDLIDGVDAALEDPDAPDAMSMFGTAMEDFHTEEIFSAYDTWAGYAADSCA